MKNKWVHSGRHNLNVVGHDALNLKSELHYVLHEFVRKIHDCYEAKKNGGWVKTLNQKIGQGAAKYKLVSLGEGSEILKWGGRKFHQELSTWGTRPLVRKCMPQYHVNDNNTRFGYGYRLFPAANLKYTQSFFPHFTKLWKNLPNSLKNERDLTVFKEKLRDKIKPKNIFISSMDQKETTLF